jgi:hypothetical protein
MSIHQLIVPGFTSMLRNLDAMLDKAGAYAAGAGLDQAELLGSRLAPDMLPLAVQVAITCSQAAQAVAKLTDGKAPDFSAPPSSIDAAKAMIAKAIAYLGAADSHIMDAAADKPVSVEVPTGLAFDLNGSEYVRDWVFPQFYFHLSIAYAILRHNGVHLGKPDYVAHMTAYLRR